VTNPAKTLLKSDVVVLTYTSDEGKAIDQRQSPLRVVLPQGRMLPGRAGKIVARSPGVGLDEDEPSGFRPAPLILPRFGGHHSEEVDGVHGGAEEAA
jgi:hypothetical protein